MRGAPPAVPNTTRPTEELRDQAFCCRLVGPDRPARDKALAAARVRQVPLVVAKVDRLTRSVAFLSRLLEAGVECAVCRSSDDRGRRGQIPVATDGGGCRARGRDDLGAHKSGSRGCEATWREAWRRPRRSINGRAAVQERARSRAMDLAPTIQELQAAGCESLRAIAAGLEERGIPAARGGKWSAVQVARLLEAASIPFDASAARRMKGKGAH